MKTMAFHEPLLQSFVLEGSLNSLTSNETFDLCQKLMLYFQCCNHQGFILCFALPKLLYNKFLQFHHLFLFSQEMALKHTYTHLQCYHLCFQFSFTTIPFLLHHQFLGFGSFQFQFVL
jgi:hypothetical protein